MSVNPTTGASSNSKSCAEPSVLCRTENSTQDAMALKDDSSPEPDKRNEAEKIDRTIETLSSGGSTNDSPTRETYAAFEEAYNHFNATLFEGRLPPSLATYPTSSRYFGYFAPNRFISSSEGKITPEIAISALYANRSAQDVLSTLVHEMTHLQHELVGQPGKRGYHNLEFARLMKAVGLICSSTGEPGGKPTGVGMSHYIEEGGPFDRTCAELLARGWRLPYVHRPVQLSSQKKLASKTRYTCACARPNNVWGKPNLQIGCYECGQQFLPERAKPVRGSEL